MDFGSPRRWRAGRVHGRGLIYNTCVVSSPERYGSYVVYEQLGKGGMATVHRAELPDRNGEIKQVALKRLLPTLEKEKVQLFLDEARLHKYLHHPNIAETYDSGRVFGTYFIAMEYVKGPTLKDVVTHCGLTTGAVPQPITLNIAAQLCEALDHAHNQRDEHGKPLNIIHRDVSPANIILSDQGLVKLIDFGLAKTSQPGAQETQAGTIKGKYGYIAPEYLSGSIDHRADLWAVGIIMYELLTSRRLFDGADAFETMMRVKRFPIPRPSLMNPRVKPELDNLVMKALERNVSYRWQTAAAMRDALREQIAVPGNHVDNAHVFEWVEWLLTLPPGKDVSGLAKLDEITAPTEADAEPTVFAPPPIDLDFELEPEPDDGVPTIPAKLWLAGVVVVALLAIVGLIVKITE